MAGALLVPPGSKHELGHVAAMALRRTQGFANFEDLVCRWSRSLRPRGGGKEGENSLY